MQNISTRGTDAGTQSKSIISALDFKHRLERLYSLIIAPRSNRDSNSDQCGTFCYIQGEIIRLVKKRNQTKYSCLFCVICPLDFTLRLLGASGIPPSPPQALNGSGREHYLMFNVC